MLTDPPNNLQGIPLLFFDLENRKGQKPLGIIK